MNDPLLMRSLERFANLCGDCERNVRGNRAVGDPVAKRLAVRQFHHDRADAAAFFEPVDGADAWMVERGEDFGLTPEPGHPINVGRHCLGQDFDGDPPLQLGVGGAVHLTHAALADLGFEFVDTEARPGGERHRPRL